MLDAGFFELYLFTMGIVIAKLIPAVLSLNIWLYVIVVAVWLAIVMPSILKKGKEKWWAANLMHNYRNWSVWNIIVYKILIGVMAFLVLKLIPSMILVDIAWYVAIAFFGMGYIIAATYRK